MSIKTPGTFTPGTTSGVVLESKYVKGGYTVVQSLEERDALRLTSKAIIVGSKVYVVDNTTEYVLYKDPKTEEIFWKESLEDGETLKELKSKVEQISSELNNKATIEDVKTEISSATIEADQVNGSVSSAKKVDNSLIIGDKAYDGSEKVVITSDDIGKLVEVPLATQKAIGGIKLGYVENKTNRAVKVDEEGRAYVTLPAALIESVDPTQFIISPEGNELSISQISTDLFVQGKLPLVLTSGNSDDIL